MRHGRMAATLHANVYIYQLLPRNCHITLSCPQQPWNRGTLELERLEIQRGVGDSRHIESCPTEQLTWIRRSPLECRFSLISTRLLSTCTLSELRDSHYYASKLKGDPGHVVTWVVFGHCSSTASSREAKLNCHEHYFENAIRKLVLFLVQLHFASGAKVV